MRCYVCGRKDGVGKPAICEGCIAALKVERKAPAPAPSASPPAEPTYDEIWSTFRKITGQETDLARYAYDRERRYIYAVARQVCVEVPQIEDLGVQDGAYVWLGTWCLAPTAK